MKSTSSPQPLYLRVGNWLKLFPHKIAQGSTEAPSMSGPAAAALLSAAFSCFLLMINQHLTVLFKSWNAVVWSLGDWIPGSRNPDPVYGEIGSYSGKETMMLLGWLLSWVILHQLWKRRNIPASYLYGGLLFFLVAATVMNWHPIFPYLPLMPK